MTRKLVGGLALAAAALLGGCGGAHHRLAAEQQLSAAYPPSPIPLASGWRYHADPDNAGLAQRLGQGGAPSEGWSAVTMPNDFNAQVPGASNRGAVGWYEVRFEAPPQSPGRSWEIHFEEVRREMAAWLNGHPIGTHEDPYTPFSLPARSLVPGQENTLLVRVDNFKRPGSFPEDWWNWGGIMGPVTLQPVGRIKLSELGVMPELGCDYSCGKVVVQAIATNLFRTALRPEIDVRITSPSGTTTLTRQPLASLPSGAATVVNFSVPVNRPLALWSPQDPALYTVKLSTLAGGRVEQVNSLHVGMRSVQVRQGILYLNGHRLWLHGAAIQQDLDGRGAALSDGDIDTIVSQLRSVGANITRAHYLLSPRLLDALDRAGIMVWSQPPVGHADQELQSSAERTRALALLQATIIGERSHPSVIVDSVGNELSPNPDASPGTSAYIGQAVALARNLDPVAPVGLDTYCYPGFPAEASYKNLDVLGISSYFGWYRGLPGHSIASFDELAPFLMQSHARYPNQALVISEFGAEGLYDGPPSVKGSYQFQSNYVVNTANVLDRLPFVNGMIYWTLREFAVGPGWVGGADLPPGDTPDGIHHKGLIAYDGTEKPAFSVASRVFSDPPPFVH